MGTKLQKGTRLEAKRPWEETGVSEMELDKCMKQRGVAERRKRQGPVGPHKRDWQEG